jgi:hypothetical protein
MLNHNQTAIMLVIGLVAVLMTSASTRVFAQPTLPPSQIETPADQHHPIESEITADQHHAIHLPAGHATHFNID